MKNKYTMMLLAVCLMSSTFAFAEEQKAIEAPAAEAKAAMDPAQMEKMKVLMSPSAAHKTLEAMVGKWNYTSKFFMTPDGKAEETTGTADNTLVYGGRFLKQEIKGTWMGQPFEGVGYTGYDNIREEYESVWLDSMTTGMMVSKGQFDAATQTLAQSGKNSCPMTGDKERACRSDWKVVDANSNVFTSYTNDASGKEVKAMEITYTKAA